jgi:hypothetical protein
MAQGTGLRAPSGQDGPRAATVRGIGDVRAHLAEAIQDLPEGSRPLITTRQGASTAVIQAHASCPRTQHALAMQREVISGRDRS